MAGQVQLIFGTPPAVLPFVKSERLEGLAVSTPKRSSFAPDIPGMAELGYPQFNFSFWYGLFAPAGTPPAIIKKLAEVLEQGMKDPEHVRRLEEQGLGIKILTGDAHMKFYREIHDQSKKYVEGAKKRPQK